MDAISDASNSMAESIEQISAVVPTNSAAAEEISASSEELFDQSEILERLTSKFNL